MADKNLRLLLVEDSAFDGALIVSRLRVEGYTLEWERVETATGLTTALTRHAWDLVIADQATAGLDAFAVIASVQDHPPAAPVVVISGALHEALAAEVLKAGAADYLLKDELWRLPHAVERAVAVAAERRERLRAEKALQESENRFRSLACHVPGMVFELARDCQGERFTFVSEGARMLLGVTPEALLADARRFLDLIVPEDRPGFFQALADSARQLDFFNWEGRLVTAYGNGPKWVNVRAGPRRREDGAVVWAGIMTNITRNKRIELDAKRSSAELLALSSHIERVKEEERARIAREIHDDLGGTLTAVKLELASLMNRLPQEGMDLLGRVSSIRILVDRAIAATSRIARDLRPPVLDFGLTPALTWQAKEFENRLGIVCDVESEPEDPVLPPELATALFRIFQEALTNVSKHANATEVHATLRSRGGQVTLEVVDNGRGVREADLAKPGSFGIRGIFERCRSLGGEAKIEALPGGGTRLSVSIPDPQASAKPPHTEHRALGPTVAEARE